MSSTTENPTFVYNDRKHEKRGDRWYILLGPGLEVSDAQNDLLDIAYEQFNQSLASAAPVSQIADSASPQDSTEIKPDVAEQQPATVEAPQVISVPLLFPVMPIPQTVTEVHEAPAVPSDYLTADDLDECMAIRTQDMDKAINQPDSGKGKCIRCGETLTPERMILCLDCTAENRHYETPAEPAVVEPAQDVMIDPKTCELLADEMIAYQNTAAANFKLNEIIKQRDAEIARLTDEKAKADRKAQHAINEAKRWKAESKVQKAANQSLIESLAATRAHIELLQKQISVQGVIETRTEQPAEVKTDSPK